MDEVWDQDTQDEWAEDEEQEITLQDEDYDILNETAEIDAIEWETNTRFRLERTGFDQ